VKKAAKKAREPKNLVETFCRYEDGVWTVQAPIIVRTENANGGKFESASRAKKHIKQTLGLLREQLRALSGDAAARGYIVGLQMVRISPGKLEKHDNLASAFKHVTDAACAWIAKGDEKLTKTEMRAIGKFDKMLDDEMGKVKWHEPLQIKCATNPKAMGIQIRLSLRK
jgi:hypothetical protein